MSKGSNRRPTNEQVFSNNFDSIDWKQTAYVVFPALDVSSIDREKSDGRLDEWVANEVSKIEIYEQVD